MSSSIRSTRPRSAGCQPATASTICACTSRAVSARPLAGAGIGVPGRMPPLSIMYGSTGSSAHVGRELGGRLVGRAARVHRAHRERDAGGRVDRDHEAARAGSRAARRGRPAAAACGRRRRGRATPVSITSTSGSSARADRRVDAVGADQHVALGGAAVVEQQRARLRRRARSRRPCRRAGRVAEPRAEDLAQRAAVDRGVRALALVGRAEVRGGRELVGTASRPRPTCAAAACCATPAGRARRGRRAGTPRSAFAAVAVDVMR